MKKNKMFFLLVVLSSFILIAGWFQQRKQITVKAQSETPKLTLEVSTLQNSYLQLEPIHFKFKLSNRTNVPIKWGASLSLREMHFSVRGENENIRRWEIRKYYLHGSLNGLIDMLPGDEVEAEDLLDGKLAEMMFSRPGRYEVQVEYIYDIYVPQREQIKFTANPIIIDIREPQGINRQAYDYLKGPYETARRKSDSTPLQGLRQNFVDNFSNSVYAKYMIFELGSIYRGLENAKAVRELCKIYNLNFYHSKRVKTMLLEINAKLYPMILNPNLPPNTPLPLIPHPCTGNPINPYNF
jgi:hypothetical protein